MDMQYLACRIEILYVSTGNSTGNCTGNPVGAARGLAAARMLFLLGRSHWYCLGVALVAVELEFCV